jgi:hypothetical protein
VTEPRTLGLAGPGELLCDFCGREEPIGYFPIEEFAVRGGGATWMSGTRFYACPQCRVLVDGEDWTTLAARCAIPPMIAAIIWPAFRDNRDGGFVEGVHPDERER